MFAAFGTFAQTTVKIDFDQNFDFSGFHNFVFADGKFITSTKDVEGDNSLLQRKIQDALVSQLKDKGFKEVGTTSTDTNFVVTYTAGAKNKQELEGGNVGPRWGGYYGYGYGGWANSGYNNWWIRDYKEGTIIIDVYDVKTKQLVWKAYCVAELNDGNNDRLLKKIAYKAFKKFPPKKKK